MILYYRLFVVCFASTNTHPSPRDNHEIPNKVMFKEIAITPESKERLLRELHRIKTILVW